MRPALTTKITNLEKGVRGTPAKQSGTVEINEKGSAAQGWRSIEP